MCFNVKYIKLYRSDFAQFLSTIY